MSLSVFICVTSIVLLLSLSLACSVHPSSHLSTCIPSIYLFNPIRIIPIQSSIAPSFTNTIVPLRRVLFAGAQKLRRAIEFEWQVWRKATNRRRKVALMRRRGLRCVGWQGEGQKPPRFFQLQMGPVNSPVNQFLDSSGATGYMSRGGQVTSHGVVLGQTWAPIGPQNKVCR